MRLESSDRFAGKFLSILVWVGGCPKKNFRFLPCSGDAVQKATSVADMWQPPISNTRTLLDMWQHQIFITQPLPDMPVLQVS